jgi:hypothetical protein
MTLLPTGFLERQSKRARLANKILLINVVEFVDEFYDELQRGDKMQAYRETAEANFCSEYNFRDRVSKVVRFRESNLLEWFANGIGWDHLENAPSLRPNDPASLIGDCLSIGGEHGDTMTVREMINFELESENKQAMQAAYYFERVKKFLGKLPIIKTWNDAKQGRWNNLIEQMKEFFNE